MKAQTLIMLAGGLAAAFIAPHASAVYTGLQVTLQRVTLQDGTLMNRYRVYAMCTHPYDYVTSVSGSPTLGNFVVQSRNADDSGFGSTFFNPPGGGLRAPSLAAIAQNPDVAHDTFGTIGITIAEQGTSSDPRDPDCTLMAPGFPGIGTVSQVNSNNAGWTTPGRVQQSRAGWLGDGDPLLRVLVMQLTVSSTSNVRGTVAISGVNEFVPGSGQSFTVAGQTFNSIPSPGVLPLLGLAALIGGRRRRDCPVASHAVPIRRENS